MIGKLKYFFFFLMILIAPFAYSEVTAIGDILDSPQAFDGLEVVIEGEVIGESLKDARGVWINILSDSRQIGVFSANAKIIDLITYWGSYRYTGDQVQIKGVFYKDCPVYQISNVRLNNLEIIEKGHENEFLVSSQKQQLTIVLFIICLTIASIYLIKLKYGKRT